MSTDIQEQSATSVADSLLASVTLMHDELSMLLAAGFSAAAETSVLVLLEDVERLRHRLAVLDHQLITQVDRRGLAQARGLRSPAHLLATLLRTSRIDAHMRVRAAQNCGPRSTFLQEELPPRHPEVAAAQAAGWVSVDQAYLVTDTINKLPGHVTDEAADGIRDALLDLAKVCGPEHVGKAARHALILAEQDGAPPEADERRELRRGFSLVNRPDGSARIGGELTAECAEALQAVFDALARPKPADDGVRDQRTGPQRRHDALLDGLTTVLRSGQVPDAGGVSTTVLITIDHQAWLSGRGVATTGHGGVITAREAIRWAGGDANVVTVALDDMLGVTALSGEHRIFTSRQRRGMAARDRGCTFPGCSAPPGWCEAHHATDYASTGRTSIDDGGLVCGYDHRERIREGWSTRMTAGRMWWVPPRWFDAEQTPIRNVAHDLP